MNTYRWIPDADPDRFFVEARCIGCGLVILDPQPFDHGLYPILCDPAATGCAHRIIAAPFGAECHDCGERYENDPSNATPPTGNTMANKSE